MSAMQHRMGLVLHVHMVYGLLTFVYDFTSK